MKTEKKTIEEDISNNINKREIEKKNENESIEFENEKLSSDENDYPFLERYNNEIDFLAKNIENIIVEVYNNNILKNKEINSQKFQKVN
jgi:hypothetical protein